MRKIIFVGLLVGALGILGPALRVEAVVINFDDQGLTGPSTFAAVVTSPQHLDIGGVLFDGGVILTNTTNLPANQTSIYGTASFAKGPTLNPLTVTFPAPITNFFLDVLNGNTTNIDYTVADNAGHSATFNLVPNLSSGQATIGFPATGTIVTITGALSTDLPWDFFIDNIHFNENLPPDLNPNPVPEPATMLLLGSGLIGLAGFARRRFKK